MYKSKILLIKYLNRYQFIIEWEYLHILVILLKNILALSDQFNSVK